MEDLFKKFINAGVGFVSLTTERVQKTIDALVQESKLSEVEGAKIMDELKQNGETKRKELEKQVQSIATRVMKTVGVAPNAEVEELKRTVKGSASSKPAAPKAAAPKAAAPKAGKPTVNSTISYTNVSSGEGAAAAAKNTVTNPATSKGGKTNATGAGKPAAPESAETKANKTAAKAISPNDNTSSTGSTLS